MNPLLVPAVAMAQLLHASYLRRLDGFLGWLSRDDNAGKLTVLNLLDAIIRAHEQHEESGAEDIASPAELRAAIQTPQEAMFRGLVEGRRQAIETAAVELLDQLETEAFRAQLATLPAEIRLRLMAELSEGLAESSAGMSYLTHHATAPHDGDADTRPALHISRLHDDGDRFVDEDLTKAMQIAAGTYAKAFENLVPGLLARSRVATEHEVVETYVRVIRVFYRYRVLNQHGYLGFVGGWDEIVEVSQLRRTVIDITAFNREQPAWVARLGRAAGTLDGLMSLVGTAVELDRFVDDPDLRNLLGFQVSLLGVAGHADEALRALRRRAGKHLAQSATMRGVGNVAAGAGVALSAWDTAAAFREEDYDRAGGHALEGVGGVITALGVKKLTVGTTQVWHPGGWVLVAAGAACTLGGGAIVLFASDPPPHPLVELFGHTYFGTKWDEVENRVDLGVLEDLLEGRAHYYRWKHPDGTPDTTRQLWSLLSVLYPVTIDVAEKEESTNAVETVLRIRVGIRVGLGSPSSYVSIRVFDLDEEHFYVLPLQPRTVVNHPWLEMLTVWPPGYDEGEEQVELWECTLLVTREVWEHASFVEVVVTPPTEVRQDLLGEFGDLPADGAADLTLAMVDRTPLAEVEG